MSELPMAQSISGKIPDVTLPESSVTRAKHLLHMCATQLRQLLNEVPDEPRNRILRGDALAVLSEIPQALAELDVRAK